MEIHCLLDRDVALARAGGGAAAVAATPKSVLHSEMDVIKEAYNELYRDEVQDANLPRRTYMGALKVLMLEILDIDGSATWVSPHPNGWDPPPPPPGSDAGERAHTCHTPYAARAEAASDAKGGCAAAAEKTRARLDLARLLSIMRTSGKRSERERPRNTASATRETSDGSAPVVDAASSPSARTSTTSPSRLPRTSFASASAEDTFAFR